MAAARPIVASDIPAIRGVLVHEDNALLFDPASPGALVEEIRRIQADAALAARLIEAARRDIQKYTWLQRARDVLRFSGVFPEAAVGVPGQAPRTTPAWEG
jgi:glycosyltransferase involved in cell wall biosynthesis